MRTLANLIALAVFCLLGASAYGDDAGTIDEIKALALEINEAFANQDQEAIKRLASPDHVSMAANYGKPLDLEEQLKTLAEFKRQPFDFSPMEVTLLGEDVALIAFENSLKGTWKGQPLAPRVFVSEIWINESGRWRQRLYQETPIDSQ